MLTDKQQAILEKELSSSVGGLVFGSGPELDALVTSGHLEWLSDAGTPPNAYFRITEKGREVLSEGK